MNIKKTHIHILAATCLAPVIAIAISSQLIKSSAQGKTYNHTKNIPHRSVGLVLGCSQKLKDGRQNLFFKNRIQAAADLYINNKVDFILVSGDNHVSTYDESSDMKTALISQGIPSSVIYCDYAGFRTLDSIVRAKQVFGATNITVISQQFHNERAIFIAKQNKINAIGFNAREVGRFNSFKTKLREKLARVKTVLDVYILHSQPKFLGKTIRISNTTPQGN